MSTFQGWPPAAFTWFEGLLADNSKSYFTEHRSTYDEAVTVDDEGTGTQLEDIRANLEGSGLEIHGETLKSAPRGVSRDHPRIRLLRHTHFIAVRREPPGPLVQSRAALDWVRDTWTMCTPLVGWLREHV